MGINERKYKIEYVKESKTDVGTGFVRIFEHPFFGVIFQGFKVFVFS